MKIQLHTWLQWKMWNIHKRRAWRAYYTDYQERVWMGTGQGGKTLRILYDLHKHKGPCTSVELKRVRPAFQPGLAWVWKIRPPTPHALSHTHAHTLFSNHKAIQNDSRTNPSTTSLVSSRPFKTHSPLFQCISLSMTKSRKFSDLAKYLHGHSKAVTGYIIFFYFKLKGSIVSCSRRPLYPLQQLKVQDGCTCGYNMFQPYR